MLGAPRQRMGVNVCGVGRNGRGRRGKADLLPLAGFDFHAIVGASLGSRAKALFFFPSPFSNEKGDPRAGAPPPGGGRSKKNTPPLTWRGVPIRASYSLTPMTTPEPTVRPAPRNLRFRVDPVPFHMLGRNEFALRRGFASGKTLVRRCRAAPSARGPPRVAHLPRKRRPRRIRGGASHCEFLTR